MVWVAAATEHRTSDVGGGVDGDGLLHKTVKEFSTIWGTAPVEPKGELEVEVQMLVATAPWWVPSISRFSNDAMR